MIIEKKARVNKDIEMFKDNLLKLDKIKLSESKKKIVELAKQYYEDSKYYHGKKDYFTAFGCINYAHGLLDSVIKF